MSFLRVLYMLRNLVLLGEADAVFNRQRHEFVNAVDYPARVGRKFHGDEQQTISSTTKVAVLDKHYAPGVADCSRTRPSHFACSRPC